MIPLTSFAGKKLALFGLGASGLASASALLAGGADLIAFDDSEDTIEKARAASKPELPRPKIATFLPAKVVMGIMKWFC